MNENAIFTRKSLIRLIWPLVVEQILAVTIGMADTVMVASCGEAAVSAVSLVDSINVLLINIFAALATGGAIICSQYIGRDDHKSANVAAKQLLIVTLGISALIMAVCLIACNGLLTLVFGKADNEIMENMAVYFLWSAASYPFIAIYNAGAALFRAMGNSRVSMLTALLMNGINIGGNALLIYGVGMGVAGAAIASLVSRVVGAVLIILLLRLQNHMIHIDRIFSFEWKPHMVKNILMIGIPNGMENGMFQIGKILVLGMITPLGKIAVSANALANSVAVFPQIPGAAIGLAMITVVGQCVGAGEYGQARKYTLQLTGVAYAAMSVLCILEFLFVSPLVGCFGVTSETAAATEQLLRFHAITCLFMWSASFVLPNGLRAAGDVRFSMVVSVLSMWIFRISFSYLFIIYFNMGVMGVWIAMVIDWAVRIVVFGIRFFSNKWMHKKVI